MAGTKTMTDWNAEEIRAHFPVLSQSVNGKSLVYLDNAASSQVPQEVIDREVLYLAKEHSNIHRGVHTLSQKATDAYEASREKVRRFINAREAKECIFVRGCTEGVNLVAYSYGRKFINEGDEIILTQMEHHANIVPWQVIAEERGAVIRVVPMNSSGELILEEYERLLNEKTKMVAITITPACTTGKSFASIACTISRPTPGQENTVSVTTDPPSNSPARMPVIVTTGISELRATCHRNTVPGISPLARAVRTWSSRSTSSIPDRSSRAMEAVVKVPSVSAGRIRLAGPS